VEKLQQAAGDRSVGLRPMGRIYARMGRRREAIEIVRTIEKEGALGGNGFALAAIYSALGDRDNAIAALEKFGRAHCCHLSSWIPSSTRCAPIPASNS